jgi:hypothetical protein
VLAKEFAGEESEHGAGLQKWIAAHKSRQPGLPIIEGVAAHVGTVPSGSLLRIGAG